MGKFNIQITITAGQGEGKTQIHKIIREALEKEGYTSRMLSPIPSLGIEDRDLIYNEETNINLFTIQKEVGNV